MLELKLELNTQDLPALQSLADDAQSALAWDVQEGADVLNANLILSPELTADEFKAMLKSYGIEVKIHDVHELPDIDWLQENRKQFPPIKVGRFFIHSLQGGIVPPENTINLEIEASIAFGSGEHQTTQGCLMAFEFLKDRPFKNALDMGCGSGILAMAIARLWNIPVLACDFDVAAITTTEENILKNNTPTVSTRLGDGYGRLQDRETFDLIAANILAGPLVDMAPDLARHLNPQGVAVLSGLLDNQASKVMDAHKKQGLTCAHRFDIKGWTTLVMERAP